MYVISWWIPACFFPGSDIASIVIFVRFRNATWKRQRKQGFAHSGSFAPLTIKEPLYRDRILRRNPDESLKSFPLCYSPSPLQLCLEISTLSSNSRNLLQFLVPTVQLLYTWKVEENLKENHTPFPLVPFGPFHKETSILRTLKIMPSTLNKIVLSWIRLQGPAKFMNVQFV